MSEPATTPDVPTPEVIKEKVDVKNDLRLEISRSEDGQALAIYVRAPLLASVVRKMAPGNYRIGDYAPIFKPILAQLVDPSNGTPVPDRCVTRPAITKVTRNFRSTTDFSWEDLPPAIMVANPDKLEEGYTLNYKVDKPIPPDIIRKWAKGFMDGCADLIANARSFKMTWVAEAEDK